MNIVNLPTYEQFDLQNALLAQIANNIAEDGENIKYLFDVKSFDDVQRLVRMGLHRIVFSIGDQFIANFDGNPEKWDIIGIDHDIPTDKKFTNSLTIQAHDCLDDIMFDNTEFLYYAEEEIPAGVQVFTEFGGDNKYKFTTSQAIPEGGFVFISNWSAVEGETYVPTKIATYDTDRTTTIETGLDVTLELSLADTLTPVNHRQRCRYGSNNYVESAIKQWYNSNADTFTWEPKTIYDRAPSEARYSGPGFLKLIDQDLVEVLGAVDKQVARNTVTDGGGQDLFSDKVFLLSRVEVFADTEGTTTGEKPYEYYSSLTVNATSGALAGRIKYLSGNPRYWFLRSPSPGYAHNVRSVFLAGELNNYIAVRASGASPACAII